MTAQQGRYRTDLQQKAEFAWCVSRIRWAMAQPSKRGASAARGDILVFMKMPTVSTTTPPTSRDQHRPAGSGIRHGGRRARTEARAVRPELGRGVANTRIYNWLASLLRPASARLPIFTSGFRAARGDASLREFLHLLAESVFRIPRPSRWRSFCSAYAGHSPASQSTPRSGWEKATIRPLRDGVRFLLIIFKIATLYSPSKLFRTREYLILLSRSRLLARIHVRNLGASIHKHGLLLVVQRVGGSFF